MYQAIGALRQYPQACYSFYYGDPLGPAFGPGYEKTAVAAILQLAAMGSPANYHGDAPFGAPGPTNDLHAAILGYYQSHGYQATVSAYADLMFKYLCTAALHPIAGAVVAPITQQSAYQLAKKLVDAHLPMASQLKTPLRGFGGCACY